MRVQRLHQRACGEQGQGAMKHRSVRAGQGHGLLGGNPDFQGKRKVHLDFLSDGDTELEEEEQCGTAGLPVAIINSRKDKTKVFTSFCSVQESLWLGACEFTTQLSDGRMVVSVDISISYYLPNFLWLKKFLPSLRHPSPKSSSGEAWKPLSYTEESGGKLLHRSLAEARHSPLILEWHNGVKMG